MPDECSNCANMRTRDYSGRSVMECRAMSPQRPSGTLAWWPQVAGTDWCSEHRSVDAQVLYIQGQGVATNQDLIPLLMSTNSNYPIVALRSLQIVNQAIATAIIGLYNGPNIDAPLGFAGAAGNQVNSYTYDPGILTGVGEDLYFSLQQGNGPVNVAAQGRMLPAPGG